MIEEEELTPIPERAKLPSMLTLYRRDLFYVPREEREYLLMPIRAAQSIIAKFPGVTDYLMDFIQVGNLMLQQAMPRRDPVWSEARYKAYVGSCITGALYDHLAWLASVHIPHSTRYNWKQAGRTEELHTLEQHLSWEFLYDQDQYIASTQTNMQAAINLAAQQKVKGLLERVNPAQQQAIKQCYGLEGTGKDEHDHTKVKEAIRRMRNKQAKEEQIAHKVKAPRERVRVQLYICEGIDHEHPRLKWAIERLREQGIEAPTTREIVTFLQKWCMSRLDEAIERGKH